MEESITKEEIEKAINQTKLGKAPGPHGFTAKFFKTSKVELTQWFQIVGNYILEEKTIPQTGQNAIISLIPKQDGCPNVKNFRPISLLNVNYKIFIKIIAELI